MCKTRANINILNSIFAIVLFAFLIQINSLHSQNWQQKGNDINEETTIGLSAFAIDLSSNGNTVAITDFDTADIVRIYEWNEGAWQQKGNTLDAEAPIANSYGIIFLSEITPISIDSGGNTVAIGVSTYDTYLYNLETPGYVRIYEWNGSTWMQKGVDIESEANADLFGWSVSLSADGNTVAISARGLGSIVFNYGHTRIYEWNGDTWIQKGTGIGEGENEGFAVTQVSLSSDGNTVAIGSYRHDDSGTDAGQVQIYEWNGNEWVQKGINIDGEEAQSWSGWSLCMDSDGSTVAIGGIHNNNAGHVRIYEWDGDSWIQKGVDLDGEAEEDGFGASVRLSSDGNSVAIGAYGNDDAGNNAGHVRVYKWDGNNWIQKGADIDGESSNDRFGSWVGMSADGNTVAASAPIGEFDGEVSIFTFCLSDTSINTIISCDAYTWIDSNTYTQSNDSATFTLPNAIGCDSVIMLNLIINTSDSTTTNIIACDAYTWIDGNTYTESNDSATITLTNTAGCDSVVTLNLIINTSDSSTENITACDFYTWIDGNTYTESNNSATITLTNTAGCDSIVMLNLTINSIDVTVTNNSPTLTANTNASDVIYQWINCNDDYSAIPGETNQSFTVTEDGNYAVIVTANSCVDTSDCIMVTVVSVFENDSKNPLITIYPNPTNDRIQIDFGNKYNDVTICLRNALGQVIFVSGYDELQKSQVEIIGPSGFYFLEITIRDYKPIIYKVLKQ